MLEVGSAKLSDVEGFERTPAALQKLGVRQKLRDLETHVRVSDRTPRCWSIVGVRLIRSSRFFVLHVGRMDVMVDPPLPFDVRDNVGSGMLL